MFSGQVLEPSTSLIACPFIDDMKDWFSFNVEDINDDGVVEIDIVTEFEFESAR